MSEATDVAGEAIARVHAAMQALFAPDVLPEIVEGVPVPRVTLDMPGDEPEPLHVFTWGTARDFGAEGFLSGAYIEASFHVWITVVATASTSDEAARIANAYQAVVMQLPLNDPTLGGICSDALAPTVRESDAWGDADGRRHAGYLLDLGYSKIIQAAPAAASALRAERG